MPRDVRVLCLVKAGERYVFMYERENLPKLLNTFGRFAANPELNFSWYDAAVLAQKARAAHKESS